jgi:hypothetical protein
VESGCTVLFPRQIATSFHQIRCRDVSLATKDSD